MSQSTTETGPRQFGRYRLMAQLAQGGMAEIFLASHRGLGGFEKLVVLKCILPALAAEPRFVQMLLDEARIAALLNHPNVVQVFDVGCIENRYYIAMEYLSGENLGAILRATSRRESQPPVEITAGILMQVAEGLHHAHTQVGSDGKPLHLVHRDVSPQNIFVLDTGAVKVVDFGIAKAKLSRTKTKTGVVKGKISYLSPEQVMGEGLDERSDIFSLGIVMWECLTGRRLHSRGSEFTMMQNIVTEDPPDPTIYNPDIPQTLVDITGRALARDKSARYQTAAELRAELAAYLKSSTLPGDTMAIAQWMQQLFQNRMRKRTDLLEAAKAEQTDLGADLLGYLSEDSGEPAGDTVLLPQQKTATPVTVAMPKKRHAAWLPVLASAATAAVLIALFLLVRPFEEPRQVVQKATVGKSSAKAVDAGLGSAIPFADASAGVVPAKNSDAAAVVRESDGGEGADRASRSLQGKTKRKGGKRKKPRGKKPPKTVATGSLNVTCLPWCEIWIDGKSSGHHSPLTDFSLTAGRHKIHVVNPPSGKKDSQVVVIKEGQPTVLRFRLR